MNTSEIRKLGLTIYHKLVNGGGCPSARDFDKFWHYTLNDDGLNCCVVAIIVKHF